jgi:hypothetical protein
MKPFLEDFYERVDLHLNDPQTSVRYSKEDRLRDLESTERVVWENLLKVTGQQSLLGRAEADYTLETDKRFYPLPGNFRQFIQFVRRDSGDPDTIMDHLRSIPMFDRGPGVEILSEQRGMRIQPMPDLNTSETWTLVYIKGPVKLHYAKAVSVADKALVMGDPPTDGGERINVDDYYNGSLIRVFSAGNNAAPQVNEVVDHQGVAGSLQLKHSWNPLPTGDVWYEFRPAVPSQYDDIYSLMVAMEVAGRRGLYAKRGALDRRFREMWGACRSYFTSNVADRAPSRIMPHREDEMDPYEHAY